MFNQQILNYIKQQVQKIIRPAPIPNVGIASNSAMSVSYASFWFRTAAILVDGLIIILIFLIVTLLYVLYFLFIGQNNPSLLSNIMQTLFYFIMLILYFPFMESRGGATFGKKIVGIKVLNANGEPVSFLRSLGRNFAKIISSLILMIGFMMAGFTKKKQGLHDIIASCVVVKSEEISVSKIWLVIIIIIFGYMSIVVILGTQSISPPFNESPLII